LILSKKPFHFFVLTQFSRSHTITPSGVTERTYIFFHTPLIHLLEQYVNLNILFYQPNMIRCRGFGN